MDYFLKFKDEAEAIANLYTTTETVENPIQVSTRMSNTLNGLELTDTDTVEYKGKSYRKVDETWYELSTKEIPAGQKFVNMSIIGIIYKPSGLMLTDETEGLEYPEMLPIDGYHVNVRTNGEDTTDILPFAIEPTNPIRVWA